MTLRTGHQHRDLRAAAAGLATLLLAGCGADPEDGTPVDSSPVSSSTPTAPPSAGPSPETSPSATPDTAATPPEDDAPSAEAERRRAACRAFRKRFDVSYRVWWGWTATGRVWWVELTWDNRTGKPVGGSIYGDVRVTGQLPDAFGWSAAAAKSGPGRKGRTGWGGSSADFVEVAPGTSSQLVAPDADTDVHTTADGTFVVTQAKTTLYPPYPGRPQPSCTLSVPERP